MGVSVLGRGKTGIAVHEYGFPTQTPSYRLSYAKVLTQK